jgi:hypothetical protein
MFRREDEREERGQPRAPKSDFGVRLTSPRRPDTGARETAGSYHVEPNNPEVHRRFILSLKRVMGIPDNG